MKQISLSIFLLSLIYMMEVNDQDITKTLEFYFDTSINDSSNVFEYDYKLTSLTLIGENDGTERLNEKSTS